MINIVEMLQSIHAQTFSTGKELRAALSDIAYKNRANLPSGFSTKDLVEWLTANRCVSQDDEQLYVYIQVVDKKAEKVEKLARLLLEAHNRELEARGDSDITRSWEPTGFQALWECEREDYRNKASFLMENGINVK